MTLLEAISGGHSAPPRGQPTVDLLETVPAFFLWSHATSPCVIAFPSIDRKSPHALNVTAPILNLVPRACVNKDLLSLPELSLGGLESLSVAPSQPSAFQTEVDLWCLEAGPAPINIDDDCGAES